MESPGQSGSSSQSSAGCPESSVTGFNCSVVSSVPQFLLLPLWLPFGVRILAVVPDLTSISHCWKRMPSEHLSWKQEPSSLQKLPETLVLLCPESLLSFKPSRGVREGNQQKLKLKFLKITPSLAEKVQQVKVLCKPGGPEFEHPAHINQLVLRWPYECWSMLSKV